MKRGQFLVLISLALIVIGITLRQHWDTLVHGTLL